MTKPINKKNKNLKQSRRNTRARTRKFDKHGYKKVYEDIITGQNQHIEVIEKELELLRSLNPLTFAWYKFKRWNLNRKLVKAMNDPDGPARRRAAIQPDLDKIMEDNKKDG